MLSRVRSKSAQLCAAATLAAMSLGAPAVAEGPKFSANVAITSDYIFRGMSQTDENPAIQGGFDMTWGMFYAGVWGSSLDFGGAVDGCGQPAGTSGDCANLEVDIYAGITPKLGPVDLDLGVIYYSYPGAKDLPTAELDFVEVKAGASIKPANNLTLGTTVFYSPEYTGELGTSWTVEGSAELSLPYDFALGGTLGYLELVDQNNANYSYWKIGLSKSFLEKFTAEVAYWDTDLSSTVCSGPLFQCDARVVGTLSASF